MTPQLKFTITEATVAPSGVDVTEPIGWMDITLALGRIDKHSLVENFEGEFVWGVDAFLLFQEIRDTVGADAKVLLTVGMKTQILGAYSTIFTGLVDIFEFEEISKIGEPYKMKVPITNANLLTTFISREKTPIDLMATTDLDGNACAAADSIILPLPCQIIQQTTKFKTDTVVTGADTDTIDELLVYSQIGLPIISGEVKETYELPLNFQNTIPGVAVIKLDKAGDVTIQAIGDMTVDANGTDIERVEVRLEARRNLEAYQTVGGDFVDYSPEEDVVSEVLDASGTYTFTDCQAGDEIVVFGFWGVRQVASAFVSYTVGFAADFEILINQQSTFQDTTTESILLKEAFKNILVKTTGVADPLVSDYLDSFTDNDLDFALQKQMHIRGYSFTDKPFTMSFDKCWKGGAPLLSLGFGYTDDGKFEIERAIDFYDPAPSLTLSEISEITKTYDEAFYINLLTLGFNKGQGDESAGGVDDAQTVKNWRTIFARIGKQITNKSDFYGAALGMEQARRNRAELTKDFRNDEEVCIIAVKADGSDWTPELGEDFVDVTNMVNSDSRYNCRLFVSRIFKRWQSFYEACLFQTSGGTFYFVDGEGNFKATVKLQPGDIEVQPEDAVDGIAENDDFEKSGDDLIIPYKYRVSGAMTYEQYSTIKANRKKAVVIPYDGVNQIMFIRELRFKLMEGTFTGEFFGGGEA